MLKFIQLTVMRQFHHEKNLANLVIICDSLNLEVGVNLSLPPRHLRINMLLH